MTGRKLQFTGALFDGRSSAKIFVEVELTPQEVILKKPDRETIRWKYSHLHWTAQTLPFQIEHHSKDENRGRLEALVVEDPEFYESVSKIAPESFSAKGNSRKKKVFCSISRGRRRELCSKKSVAYK